MSQAPAYGLASVFGNWKDNKYFHRVHSELSSQGHRGANRHMVSVCPGVWA